MNTHLTASSPGPSTRADEAGAMPARLDAVIERAIADQRIVGTVMLVLRGGHVVYRAAAGLADRESDTPMRADQIFRLSSVTKPIVSLAALRLIDRARLALDREVGHYLHDFQPRLADGEARPITIRQLLTHTSGLSYRHFDRVGGPYDRADVSDGFDQPGLSMKEALRRVEAAGLIAVPGTQWNYSVGLDVLGAVIERVLDKSLPEAVRELISEPLGMVDTDFVVRDRARLATPYADGAPPVRMGEPHLVPFMGLSGLRFSPARALEARSYPSGGSGMNGTADDVARLLELVRTGGGNLLKPATARAMMTNQIGSLPTVLGPGWGFGFGGAVLTDPAAANTPQAAGTWTWGGVWGHNWFVDPANELVVVGLTNTAIEGMMGQFPIDVRNAVYGRDRAL